MTTAIAHAKPCTHDKYRMTCEEFDQLRDHAKDCCQICGILWPDTPHGALHIDHDARIGEWAVRGLLCSRCNTQLDSHVHVLDSGRVGQYLSHPWYWVWLARLGLSPDSAPEPPLGMGVETRQGKVWRRTEAGWVRANRHGRVMWTTTWDTLQRKHGPFLRQVDITRATGYTREHIRQLVLADKKKREGGK